MSIRMTLDIYDLVTRILIALVTIQKILVNAKNKCSLLDFSVIINWFKAFTNKHQCRIENTACVNDIV